MWSHYGQRSETDQLTVWFSLQQITSPPVTPQLQTQAFVRRAPTDLAFSSSARTDAMSCFSLSTPRYSEFFDVIFTDGKVNGRQNNEQWLLPIFYLSFSFPESLRLKWKQI
jgi:hypothetical protein